MLFRTAAPLLLAASLFAQTPQDSRDLIRTQYTKYEFLIPMRDGVKLFTAVYAPKDQSQAYPILMNRTPYSVAPYGSDNYRAVLAPSEKYMQEGFIFVFQDVRGKGKSEGAFVNVRPIIPVKKGPKDIDESTDTYDTIDWLVKNIPNNNGRVGMYGISYPGFYAAIGAIDAHPALKATSPQAPVTDWFMGDDFRHNGVIFLAHAFGFLSSFGRPAEPEGTVPGPRLEMGTPDGYDYHLRMGGLPNYDEKLFHGKIEFWKDLLDNDTYNEFWRSRNPRPYFKDVKPAVMWVGGWLDAEDVFGPLRSYAATEKQSPGATNIIVEGPWVHGGWSRGDGDRVGNVRFNQKASLFFRENIEFPFFLFYLKGKGDGGKLPEAYMFNMGRNEWRKHDAWPPREAKPTTFYFDAGGKLSTTAPAATSEAFDEYVSDPMKPVPFIGEITQGMTYTYMTADQRFATSRTDVLSYQTEPLESDLTIAGPLRAILHVSTTGTDSDFVVKLVDVYPGDYPNPDPNPANVQMGGYQQLVRGEPFRGKFRNSFETPEPFTPGKRDKVEFEMPDVYHTFRSGHRVMVQVQSSWFPLCDRNPQKFMKIQDAKATDFQKATERVYHMTGAASGLQMLVLP
jgi:putative CocE/NonD family hydrolase